VTHLPENPKDILRLPFPVKLMAPLAMSMINQTGKVAEIYTSPPKTSPFDPSGEKLIPVS